jgi:Ca2+-binding RTX toxin-like protein
MSIRRLSLSAIGAVLALAALFPGGSVAEQSAAPGCPEALTLVGSTIKGTACDDLIVAPARVAVVQGGGGDDTIVPAPILAATSCPSGCHLDIGSQTFEGGPGDDVVYGERGNDRLFGGAGDDQLFGGIGDDLLEGGLGNDRLVGGFGFDSIDGQGDDDYVRGDATIDTLVDRGGGTDTLSYSTGITPGFFDNHAPDFSAVPGLPPAGGERGVYVDLTGTTGDNGVAPFGGGIDTVEVGGFEVVIGTAFSDYIVGGGAGETIYGGGGGDVIRGAGGNDTLYGGADGDDLDGGTDANSLDGGAGSDHCASPSGGTSCESGVNTGGVVLRDQSKISAGLLAPADPRYSQVYLTGSSLTDKVTVTYTAGPPVSVSFNLGSGSAAFDASASAAGGCSPPAGTQLTCPLSKPLDSIMLAGLGGGDTLNASGLPDSVSVVLAGGEGNDSLTGGELSEDVLADGPDDGGPGNDILSAFGGDDALLNNEGFDQLLGGTGNDLFLSDSICDGDVLDGGAERDNASWTKFNESGVAANLSSGTAGAPGPGGSPTCPSGSLGSILSIEDLEGTTLGDFFTGNSEENQLLGWAGADTYSSGAGKDRILANSADVDPLIDCGADADVALIDRPPVVETAAPNCENVQEAAPNNFRVETELEVPVVRIPESLAPETPVTKPPGGRPPANKPRQLRSCLASSRSGPLRCAMRPRNLGLGALGRLDGIRWTHWGSRRTTGFGRLTILRGRRAPQSRIPARIKVGRPELCNSRRWYTRFTVNYGRGYGKTFLLQANSATPCS